VVFFSGACDINGLANNGDSNRKEEKQREAKFLHLVLTLLVDYPLPKNLLT
jgi:hypothetical protein